MRRIIVAIAMLASLVVLPGCKKQVACDPADSDESMQSIPAMSSFGYLG